MSLVFDTQFFSNLSPASGTLAGFATLGVGIVARPLGGIVWGHFGDVVGREAMLVASLLVMGLATVAVGLLPTTRREFSDLDVDTSAVSVPTRHGAVRCTVYRPPGSDSRRPVYVNVHGGGFVIRFPEQDDAWCRYLAVHTGVVVLNPDYDTAPQHRFPVPVEQVYDVVSWAAAPERDWDGSRLCVGGQSAGGNLATAAARLAVTNGGPRIALQVLHYPVLDMATPPAEKAYRGGAVPPPWMGAVFNRAYQPDLAQRLHPLASPALVPGSAGLEDIAPAVLVTAERDRLRDEAVAYARSLDAVGRLVAQHDVPGVDHGYDIREESPATTRRAYALIADHVTHATRAARD